jgi:hypothetical protein
MRTQTFKEISAREGGWDALFRRVLVPLGGLLEAGEFLLLALFIGLCCLGKWYW